MIKYNKIDMKIKRFEQVNEQVNETTREDGFYWVLFKNDTKWTVGRYTSSDGDYPWEVVASDEIFSDGNFGRIGDKIEYKK